MCTASWIHTAVGYQLLCNRDELDTRARAEAPRVFEDEGVRYIAPVDGDHGGTWIAANEEGVSVALLNRGERARGDALSRGLLVKALASSKSLEEVGRRLVRTDLTRYGGFQLVALEPGRNARLFEWDTRELVVTRHAEGRMPLSSSSYDAAGVARARSAEFASRLQMARRPGSDVLLRLHRSHGIAGDRPSAYTPCMHRPGAQTVSFSWIEVTDLQVQFLYSPDAPCRREPGRVVQLGRVGSGVAACG